VEEVRRISEALAIAAGEAGLSPGELIDLDLAVVEAANNIVLHGYGGDGERSYEPIPAQRLAASSSAPFDAECGRGFGIIHACVDELAYESEGGVNRLTLIKNRSGRAA
jgi:serine/threonine-protein kinase RsbW